MTQQRLEDALGTNPEGLMDRVDRVDAGNGRNWGQVLIGNQAKEQHEFQKNFENDVCYRLPSPAMQRPDILTATPDTPPDIDCGAALDLLDQDPTINQMMAMLVVQVVRRMAANDCPWMSLYLDLELRPKSTLT